MFSIDDLLTIAYSVSISEPEGQKKDELLNKIAKLITKHGNIAEKVCYNRIKNIPDLPNEDWYEDLKRHRDFYSSKRPDKAEVWGSLFPEYKKHK